MKKIIVILMLCCLPKLMAQTANVTSGGTALGSGGSSTYSVGQVVNENLTGTNGRLNQGVQQPFEIATLGEDDFPEITLTMSVYPNPTAASVNLNIQNYNAENLNYQLFDLNGRIITQQKITQTETQISLENSANAIYLLQVSRDEKPIKTFKIIKN